MRTAVLTALGCLLAGALSLLVFNHGLTYDPAAWAVWAAELPHRRMGLGSGPSWKPLPVLVTAPFALISWNFGGTAWLAIVRACGFATSLLLWRMAHRISSETAPAEARPAAALTAGMTAALLPWLIPSWFQFFLAGGSEPVLMALLLVAVEAHLAGRRNVAVALGVLAGLIRPEVWALLLIYGIWLLRREGSRALLPLGIGAAAELVGWFGIPALAGGDPLQATHRARVYTAAIVPVDEFARRVATELPWPAWVLIALGIAVAVRLRNGLLTAFTVAGLGWLLVVTAMTESGYSGISRYAVPALVLLAVPAGAAVGLAVGSAGRHVRVGAVVAFGLLGVILGSRAQLLGDRADRVERVGTLAQAAVRAMDSAGGAHELIARHGILGTNWIYTPVIAWRAHVSIGNIGHRDKAPAVLLLPPGTTTVTKPAVRNNFQPVPPIGSCPPIILAAGGGWRVAQYAASSRGCQPGVPVATSR